jgi:hypothetical protein
MRALDFSVSVSTWSISAEQEAMIALESAFAKLPVSG